MSQYFGLSFRFLDQRFHGQAEAGEPEWPPSPLRVFQALVTASSRIGRGQLHQSAVAALKWLEGISAETPPVIVAPSTVAPDSLSPGYCLSVPNNAMDIVAKAWCRGNDSNKGDASPATHRTLKGMRPVHLQTDDAVHYLWPLQAPLSDEIHDQVETLVRCARSVSALGWGIDMAIGDAGIFTVDQAKVLTGEKWLPSSAISSEGLRVPVPGTLENLSKRHNGFLKRLEGDKFTPPPPLSRFAKFEYRRDIDPPRRSVAAFALLNLDARGFRTFDTTKWALTVAGMTRHATRCAAERSGWAESKVDTLVLGHGESRDGSEHVSVGNRRFAYLPLPSIEARGPGKAAVVGSVRRVMLAAFDEGYEREIEWARSALSGQLLIPEQAQKIECTEVAREPLGVLSLLPAADPVVRSYLRPSSTWATVTPVVLPGHDDPAHYRRRLKDGVKSEEQKRLLGILSERVAGLIRKAITQAGISQAMADMARIEWRKAGYWRGTELADRYGVPDHLKRFPRYHVKIQWRDESGQSITVPGPICLGGGRFYGLGLMAAF
jgi:CRISPR-associated protein Csb2